MQTIMQTKMLASILAFFCCSFTKSDGNKQWEAVITNRNRGTGCPYCSGKQAIVGYNDLATTNPILAKEW